MAPSPPGIPQSSAPLPTGSPPLRSLPGGPPRLCAPPPPPPTYGCIVVEADVGAFPVAGPVHQLALVRVSRGSFAGQGNDGDQGGGGGDDSGVPHGPHGHGAALPPPTPQPPALPPPAHQRIPLTSACSSLTDSHWLQRGLSATTKSRLVLASLCAWKSLGDARLVTVLSHPVPSHPVLPPPPQSPRGHAAPHPWGQTHLEQFPQSMMAL